MLELCRRKMKMGGLEERRIMGLENAYYQVSSLLLHPCFLD